MPNKSNHQGLFISTFNVQNLTDYLLNDATLPSITPITTPYGQVIHQLLTSSNEQKLFSFIWTLPQAISETFAKLLQGEEVEFQKIMEEVIEFSHLVVKHAESVPYTFVASWILPGTYRGLGFNDLKYNTGIANCLLQMNLELSRQFASSNNIYLLDAQKWIEKSEGEAFNPKLWYMSKTPFSQNVFKAAAAELKSALMSLSGGTRKIIFLDLDDTLWGGIVGDIGWVNLQLGGHHFAGEAFVDFQKNLKTLKNRGILLAIASKNDEETALGAIEKNPEMILTRNDFVDWEINWSDKSENIAKMLQRINLGSQSAVFIDDNPVERARVKEAFPEMLVPDWPKDSMNYSKALHHLTCFDTPFVTAEDMQRTQLYKAENKRNESRSSIQSIDDWISSLKTVVTIEPLTKENLQRSVQLLNKTNQMNLTTRRLSDTELEQWAREQNHSLWTFRVADKFGDSGLTGILSLQYDAAKAVIIDFLLSCRVMGRKVEELMLSHAVKFCKSKAIKLLEAQFIETPKNKPCREFFQTKSGFFFDENRNLFTWNCNELYPKINQIEIQEKMSDE